MLIAVAVPYVHNKERASPHANSSAWWPDIDQGWLSSEHGPTSHTHTKSLTHRPRGPPAMWGHL